MKALFPTTLFYLLVTVTFSQEKSLFQPLNDLRIGTFSLEAQHVFMVRDRQSDSLYTGASNYDEHAQSLALKAGYTSPQKWPVGGHVKFIAAEPLFYGGSYAGNAAEHLQLSQLTFLNEASLSYRLNRKDSMGLRRGDPLLTFTIGRQLLHTEFTPTYAIRQTKQSFEAAVVRLPELGSWNVQFGHIRAFNDWKSTTTFTPIHRLEPNTTNQSGMQYFQAAYEPAGVRSLRLVLFDFYGHDLYNVMGASMYRGFATIGSWQPELSLRYVNQTSSGSYTRANPGHIFANAFQTGIRFHRVTKEDDRSLWFEPGLLVMTGNPIEHTLRTPFQGTLIVHEPLFEIDLGREGGSRTVYAMGSYTNGPDKLFLLYLRTGYRQPEGVIEEIDLIYTRTIKKRLSISVKAAVAQYEWLRGGTNRVLDYRIFTSYLF